MTPSERIDEMIAGLPDWRGRTLGAVRKAFLKADHEMVEEWKWKGSPVWECDGMIAVANAHKDKVKITFYNGAKLADPDRLFNNGLDGNRWRAIDLYAGDKVEAAALTRLVRAAVEYNQGKGKKKAPAVKRTKTSKTKLPSP